MQVHLGLLADRQTTVIAMTMLEDGELLFSQ
jgi:hypothetical protein